MSVPADYFDVTDLDRQRAYGLPRNHVARALADSRISGYAQGAADAFQRITDDRDQLAEAIYVHFGENDIRPWTDAHPDDRAECYGIADVAIRVLAAADRALPRDPWLRTPHGW